MFATVLIAVLLGCPLLDAVYQSKARAESMTPVHQNKD